MSTRDQLAGYTSDLGKRWQIRPRDSENRGEDKGDLDCIYLFYDFYSFIERGREG